MGEFLTLERPETPPKEFDPRERTIGNIEEYIEEDRKKFGKVVAFFAKNYLKQGNFSLFCAVINEEYKRRLEFLDVPKHPNLKGKINNYFAYLDNTLKPYYEVNRRDYDLEKQGTLAEHAVMKLFKERYGKQVFYSSPEADTESKIDCVIKWSENRSLLMQIKNYNSLDRVYIVSGKDEEHLRDNLGQLLGGKRIKGLSPEDLGKMYNYIQTLPEKDKYRMVLCLFPFNVRVGQNLQAYFDQFGEPQTIMAEQFDQVFRKEK